MEKKCRTTQRAHTVSMLFVTYFLVFPAFSWKFSRRFLGAKWQHTICALSVCKRDVSLTLHFVLAKLSSFAKSVLKESWTKHKKNHHQVPATNLHDHHHKTIQDHTRPSFVVSYPRLRPLLHRSLTPFPRRESSHWQCVGSQGILGDLDIWRVIFLSGGHTWAQGYPNIITSFHTHSSARSVQLSPSCSSSLDRHDCWRAISWGPKSSVKDSVVLLSRQKDEAIWGAKVQSAMNPIYAAFELPLQPPNLELIQGAPRFIHDCGWTSIPRGVGAKLEMSYHNCQRKGPLTEYWQSCLLWLSGFLPFISVDVFPGQGLPIVTPTAKKVAQSFSCHVPHIQWPISRGARNCRQ